jgi:hypothetical protein
VALLLLLAMRFALQVLFQMFPASCNSAAKQHNITYPEAATPEHYAIKSQAVAGLNRAAQL